MFRRVLLMQPLPPYAVARLAHRQPRQHLQRTVQKMREQCRGLPKRPVVRPMQVLVGVVQVRLVEHRVPTTRAYQRMLVALETCALQLPTTARLYRLALSRKSSEQHQHRLQSHEWIGGAHLLRIQAFPSRATHVKHQRPDDLRRLKHQAN